MTTYATRPLTDTRISAPRARPLEIADTLADRYDVVRRRCPGSLEELVDEVQRALDEGYAIRAVGAARGLSVATDPVGVVPVSTEALRRIYPRHARDIPGLLLAPGASHTTLIRAQAGVPGRDVLRALTSESPPRTLPTHGSGDFQSIAGALSTGTHGTGSFPSMAGLVRALVVVRVDASGPSPEPRVELIQRSLKATGDQLPVYRRPRGGAWTSAGGVPVHAVFDDDAFFAHLVGLGCLGLLYCVTLDALPRVPLMRMERRPAPLIDAIAAFRADAARPDARSELIVDPYPRVRRDGDVTRWRDVGSIDPAAVDLAPFRAQLIRRLPSAEAGPDGKLPTAIQLGREGFAAGILGGRIGALLDDPARVGPSGSQAMLANTSTARYVDWLPNVLLLNLKYSGTGAEWAVPLARLEDALWAIFIDNWKTWSDYQRRSAPGGRWRGTEQQRLDLLAARAPLYNGPAVRLITGEGALLAGTHRLGTDGRPVAQWAAIEVGLLGRPKIEADWRPRKRHAGIRPEQPIPLDAIDDLLGPLRARDARSPGGEAAWGPATDLPPIRGPMRRAAMIRFAHYEHGRLATLDRLHGALCAAAVGGRPHQGLQNQLDGAALDRLWGDAAARWRARHAAVDPTGVFDSALTRRWALRDPVRPPTT